MFGLLETLGLTAYEARALEYLLRHGERTGPGLSREADIPFGRVYDTLHALVERGLVHVEPGRPKRFRATVAAAVPGRLLASNQRRMQEEARRLASQAEQLEQALGELTTKPDPGGSYGIRMGEASAREFLVEATHEARGQVVAFLALERIEADDLAVFDAFRQAVDRGVHTRVLLRADDVDYLMTTPYVDDVLDAMLPHLGRNLDVRLLKTGHVDVPFAALDRHRAMLGVKNPLDPKAYFAVIHVEDSVFAMGLEGRFDSLWERATEPSEWIQFALSKRGGRAMARFGARLRR